MAKRRRYRRRRRSNDLLLGGFLLFMVAYSKLGADNLIKIAVFVVASVAIVFFSVKYYRRSVLLKSGIKQVDSASGEHFEEILQAFFEKDGYKARTTPKSNDYGADLILDKKGVRTVVQAKRYSNTVGIEAVQQVIGAIKYYNADDGMVITNNKYTPQAIALAKAHGIVLWDRNKLIQFMYKNRGNELFDNMTQDVKPEQEEMEVTKTIEPVCPACGKDLVIRKGKNGKFFGCSGFPDCEYTKKI